MKRSRRRTGGEERSRRRRRRRRNLEEIKQPHLEGLGFMNLEVSGRLGQKYDVGI